MLHLLALASPGSRLLRIGFALALLAACSPTYQSLYEGDVRFEHCYRVDDERKVPIADKLQCWLDWSHHHRYGQSRDRIAYALARERTLAEALAAGEQAVPRGAVGTPWRMLPQPTNAYAPPPQTMTPASATAEASMGSEGTRGARETTAGDGGTTSEAFSLATSNGEANTPLVDAPGASCSGACGKLWIGCKQQCKASACQSGCDDHYRRCMQACY